MTGAPRPQSAALLISPGIDDTRDSIQTEPLVAII
jgi:hypothetical protein